MTPRRLYVGLAVVASMWQILLAYFFWDVDCRVNSCALALWVTFLPLLLLPLVGGALLLQMRVPSPRWGTLRVSASSLGVTLLTLAALVFAKMPRASDAEGVLSGSERDDTLALGIGILVFTPIVVALGSVLVAVGRALRSRLSGGASKLSP